SWGLYSHVSICDVAPCMNRKITRFALAGKWVSLGASGLGAIRRETSAARADSWPSRPARARWPNPMPADFKTWRRERPMEAMFGPDRMGGMCRGDPLGVGAARPEAWSLDVAERRASQKGLAEARPGGGLGRRRPDDFFRHGDLDRHLLIRIDRR